MPASLVSTSLVSTSLVRMTPGRLSRRRRRRLRTMVVLLAVWAVLFGWALVSAVDHDRAAEAHGVAAAAIGPVAPHATWFADDVSDYDDGSPTPAIAGEPDISVDTEGALADWQHVSDAALYVGDR